MCIRDRVAVLANVRAKGTKSAEIDQRSIIVVLQEDENPACLEFCQREKVQI